jgi:hypothetical protein
LLDSFDDSSRHGQLSDMPHRMLGAMYEAADDGRWQPRTTDGPEIAECRGVGCAKLLDRSVDARGNGVEYVVNVVAVNWLALSFHRGELRVGQRLPSRVREESIDDTGDVSHVKRGRRDIDWTRIPLIVGEPVDHLADALVDLAQDVRDWLKGRRDSVDRSALPDFGLCHAFKLQGCPISSRDRRRHV